MPPRSTSMTGAPPGSSGRSCGSVRLPAVKTGGCSSSSTVSAPRARDDLLVHLALEVPGGEVVDGVVAETGDLDVERVRGDLVRRHGPERTPLGRPSRRGSALRHTDRHPWVRVRMTQAGRTDERLWMTPAAGRGIGEGGGVDPRRLLPALTAVACALVVAMLVVVVARPDPAPRPRLASPASSPASSPSAPQPARSGPAAVLAAWDERRSAAWAEGDAGALARLYADGSGAGAADVRLLRDYGRRGLRVEGMATQVLALRVAGAVAGPARAGGHRPRGRGGGRRVRRAGVAAGRPALHAPGGAGPRGREVGGGGGARSGRARRPAPRARPRPRSRSRRARGLPVGR